MDRNLKYLILERLSENDQYPDKDAEEIYRDEFGEKWDTMADYNYEPNPRIEEYYEKVNPADYGAEKLESLVLDDVLDIYHNVWGQWDGECDYFDIESLEGIEVCSGLTELDLSISLQIKDISPLKALKKLTTLTISNNCYGTTHTLEGLEVLLELDKLESVTIENIKISSKEKMEEIVKELEGKGVDVNIELAE